MTTRDAVSPARPEFTFPAAEAEVLRAAYARAEVILEYGSGGSTVLAGELGKRVTSVESDKAWAEMMRAWFAANPPAGEVDILHADIGPTKEWGHPRSDRGWRRYVQYPLAVWDKPGFAQPDVVLIDGRFRAGCLLAVLFRASRPTTVFFDDYAGRKRYHEVEDFVKPKEMTGRMARFEITPRQIAPGELMRVMELMQRPL